MFIDLCLGSSFARVNSFHETVLILKAATTQVLAVAVIAMPLLAFYRGHMTYSEGLSSVFTNTISIPHMRLQFDVTFSWPSFSVPQFRWAMIASVSLLIIQYGLRFAKQGLRWALINVSFIQLETPMQVHPFEKGVMRFLSFLR